MNQKSHGNGHNIAPLDFAVVHDCLRGFVGGSRAALVQHAVKFKILPQNAVVKAEVKRFGRVGFGVEPENDFGLIKF